LFSGIDETRKKNDFVKERIHFISNILSSATLAD